MSTFFWVGDATWIGDQDIVRRDCPRQIRPQLGKSVSKIIKNKWEENEVKRDKKISKTKGITLVALIITIIVMLILVGVSIQVVINSNLIGTAQDAADRTETAYAEEGNMSKVKINGQEYNTIEKYLELSGVAVGDYVNYTPAGTAYTTKYTDSVQQKYSGYTSNQEVYLQNTKWRILNINADGSIDLISEKEVYIGNTSGNTTKLHLKGATGYNNGVEILNDVCDQLYGTGVKVKEARSLKIEDIKAKMDTSVWNWKDYENGDGYKVNDTETYETSAAYYPARWSQELTANINGSSTNGELEQSEEGTLIEWDTTNNAEKVGLTYFPTDTDGASITVTNTYWNQQAWAVTNFTNPIYYNILITHEDGTNFSNWLASRYTVLGSSNSGFGLCRVDYACVDGYRTFRSDEVVTDRQCGLRPVVTLESTVQMTKDETNSNDDVTYWNYN